MQTVEQLNERFAVADVARFESGQGGLPRLSIRSKLAEAHVYPHGAHITHYQPEGQEPVLYLSATSFFADGKPIRGGVPVIFPWFGPRENEPAAMHGFVRARAWDVAEVTQEEQAMRAVLTL